MKTQWLVFLLVVATAARSRTYYIDYENGSDNNDGLAKVTVGSHGPWKHAPGMQGCLYTDPNNNPCRVRTHFSVNGDTIILKGGVAWPAAALSWDWYFGNSTTFTVDLAWFSGASWSQPVLDNEGVETMASPEGITAMMRAYGNNNVVDNMEFKGVAQLHGGDNGYGAGMLVIGTSSPSGGEVKNCYFHGWSHGPTVAGNWVSDGTLAGDNSILLTSALLSSPDMDLKIHHNVWDGSDSYPTPGDMALAYKGSAGHFYNNYISTIQNGLVGLKFGYVWGNTFKEIATVDDFNLTQHHQSFEENCGQTIFYNNYIVNSGGGGTVLTYGIDNFKDYIFNNVIIGDGNQSLQLGTKNGSSVTLVTGNGYEMHVFNNTIQTKDGNNSRPINGPYLSDAALMPLMAVRNNHLIGPNATVNFFTGVAVTGKIESNTFSQTNAQATGTGYVANSASPYYPPSGSAGTVRAGYNLTSFCSTLPAQGPSDAASACLQSTTQGVSYDSVNHRVIGPGKKAVARPAGDAWDVGAYQYVMNKIQKANGKMLNGPATQPLLSNPIKAALFKQYLQENNDLRVYDLEGNFFKKEFMPKDGVYLLHENMNNLTQKVMVIK